MCLFRSLFPPFLSSTLPPSLLPGYQSIKSSQICGNIIKYVQEDVMPFENCLHALIFPSETAALPLPQRRQLRSNSKIFTYTPLKKKPYANNTKNPQSRNGVGTGSTLALRKPKGSAVRSPHWELKKEKRNNNNSNSSSSSVLSFDTGSNGDV